MILWLSIAAAALVLGWLLLLLSRQGAGPQIAHARQLTSTSCQALQAGAARVRQQLPSAGDRRRSMVPAAAQAVLDLALRDQPGMEGGFWRADAGVVAYAFPTYDGTGIKRDPPSAELERIGSTAQRAQDSAGLVTDVRPGLREAVAFAACPVEAVGGDGGDGGRLIAWTLMRVPLLAAETVNTLTLAVSLLLALVAVSGAWLGWMISRWQRQSAHLQQQLAQSERLATLGRVSAGLAHEIRNPLGTMRMKVENAMAAPADLREARVAGALEAVLAQTARLETLVSSLLALTQPFRAERQVVDLAAWLEERRNAHAETAQRLGIRITLAVAPELAASARGLALFDPAQMARVYDNLLLNAMAHTGEGGEIELGARGARGACGPRGPRGGALLLWVADDGSGIPDDLRDTLFEPFATARAGGTGLGLALVREIVQGHGGRVALAESAKGTRIEMELPWPRS
ncbi:two-component sensor histidine kinase [Cupriavidus malaysiensis]|uniref:histidine kinase n=1 Tax=Cupriavidus malaysiensis TaxID=367825 RepID=A0ABN4TZP1_9BURK|nr:two-component sensor histidine kinase [Cupriavidus malaysiensis]